MNAKLSPHSSSTLAPPATHPTFLLEYQSTIFQWICQHYFWIIFHVISCPLKTRKWGQCLSNIYLEIKLTILKYFVPFFINFTAFEKLKVLSAMSLTVALTMKTNTPVFSIGFQYIRQLAKFGWKEAISYPKVANLSVHKRKKNFHNSTPQQGLQKQSHW